MARAKAVVRRRTNARQPNARLSFEPDRVPRRLSSKPVAVQSGPRDYPCFVRAEAWWTFSKLSPRGASDPAARGLRRPETFVDWEAMAAARA